MDNQKVESSPAKSSAGLLQDYRIVIILHCTGVEVLCAIHTSTLPHEPCAFFWAATWAAHESKVWGKFWSLKAAVNTLFLQVRKGWGIGGRGLAPGAGWQFCVIGWQQARDSYLYPREGVPVVVVVVWFQIRIYFFFFQPPREVEIGQDRWELNERLQQDSEHGAYNVVERGESEQVAPRWDTYCFSLSNALITSQVLWLAR